MLARLALIIIAYFLTGVASCGLVDEGTGSTVDECPAQCPSGYYPVNFCPAFTNCIEKDHCPDLVICAPDVEEDAGFPGDDAGVDCSDPLECPQGTLKVSACPEDQICTRVSRCGESIICLESDLLCQQEPLCPDGDRPLEGCDDDDQCYRHNHCSGPVDCLRCDEYLPDGCPQETASVEALLCTDQTSCQTVETCDKTLYCVPLELCDRTVNCPLGSHEVDQCDSADNDLSCFPIHSCEGSFYCEASQPDCDAMPFCPPETKQVPLDDCAADPLGCEIVVLCASAIGCSQND